MGGVVIILLMGGAWLWWHFKQRDARMAEIAARKDIALIEEGFAPVLVDRMCDNQWGVAIDTANNRFAVGHLGKRQVWRFDQLLRVEALTNGVPVTQGGGQGGNVVGAAVLGDLIAGPIGALAGAAMAANRIKSLSLRLLTDDLAQPWQDVVFLDLKSGLAPRHRTVQAALQPWKAWEGRFLTIIARQPQVGANQRPDREIQV